MCRPPPHRCSVPDMARQSRQAIRDAALAARVGRIIATYKAMDWGKRHARYELIVGNPRNPYGPLIRARMSPCDLLYGTSTGAAAPVVIALRNKVKRQKLLSEFGFIFIRRRAGILLDV